ncbi:glutathione peroxidase [Eubacteriaceae bacterium ES2]|nr:glutathione peroxidase [Eubacteriaceae bacterium ES2]
MSIYNYKLREKNGDELSMASYKGKVLLIVNTATGCGFTPQFEDLQDLYEKYQAQGFEVLDFPCNQFGNQAPGSDEEITDFCNSRYGITFKQFSKIDVNGENALPLFNFLQNEKPFEGFDPNHPLTSVLENMLQSAQPDFREKPDIKWNFTKFLIDRKGNVAVRFEATEDQTIIEEKIQALLEMEANANDL